MSQKEKELSKKLFELTQTLLREEGQLGQLGLAIHVALLSAASGELNDFMQVVVDFIEKKAGEEKGEIRKGISEECDSALDKLIKEVGGICLN